MSVRKKPATAACGMRTIGLLLAAAVIVTAQRVPPRFEDFPASTDWKGPVMPPRLITPLDHFFRTRLMNAVNEPPNFATHYRFAMWGCGSECAPGAVIDLATGELIAPPLAPIWMRFSVCQSAYEGFGVGVRVDSKLMIVRCGRNFGKQLQRNVPDVYYFVLDGKRFRQLTHFHGRAGRRETRMLLRRLHEEDRRS